MSPLEATFEFASRYGPPDFAAVGLPSDSILVPLLLDPSRCHAGNRATLWLSD